METDILRVKGLVRTYGSGDASVTAVDDVSFRVKKGEIVLIMGPSGSGKTTLLSMIGGLLKPTAGVVQLDEKELASLRSRELADVRLRSVGFVFQAFNLLQNLSALENIQYVGQLMGMSIEESQRKAKGLLGRLHLESRMHARPPKLSGGEQQRVSIARALMNDPKLVLADEPTGNLDSRSGHEVMMLFHNIAKDEGRSVIIVSHDQRIRDIADRTLWIEDGKISEEPPAPQQTSKDPVCGMSVDVEHTPFSKTVEKQEYKFCSQDCLEKFSEHPYKYVGRLK